jgi:carbon-monoxide dehydrogenase small subunit
VKAPLSLLVNGDPVDLLCDGGDTLLEVLREQVGLTGTKHGCELGECGACTVIVDGQPALSCLLPAHEAAGCSVTTVEGLALDSRLHPLQEAFARWGGSQCGYCSPGMLASAKALLDRTPDPTVDEVRLALAGNICRCTGYQDIVEAVLDAARRSP